MTKSVDEIKRELLEHNDDIKYIMSTKFDDIENTITAIMAVRDKLYQEHKNSPLKEYRPNYVFDENKSVKWNKEEREKRNNEYYEHKRNWRNTEYAFHSLISDTIIDYIENDSVIENRKMAEIVYDYAYTQSADDGYIALIDTADTYLSLIFDIMNAKK